MFAKPFPVSSRSQAVEGVPRALKPVFQVDQGTRAFRGPRNRLSRCRFVSREGNWGVKPVAAAGQSGYFHLQFECNLNFEWSLGSALDG